ncbi:MAG: hypothetical protein KIG48_08595 [Eubacteriales bacterium]|nr:hypothetical protein [Eubacteriales bacterium]
MKKVFALLLVFVMLLSAVPVLAEGEPQISSVNLLNDDYDGLGRRVSIELKNLPPINDNSIIEVELYSEGKLLTKVRLASNKLGELAGKTALTCCIPFIGADAYWPQDPEFKPQRDVVADKAVLYVDDINVHELAFELNTNTWNAMVPITPDDLYVTNEVKLSREITPKAYENPKDTYLVNSTYGNYVSYTATMDMTKLEGSPLMNELAKAIQANQPNQVPLNEGMWYILSNNYDKLSAEVTLTFTFDPMIDLSNYDTANITLDSNMLKIKDKGIQVSGNNIIINCEFNPALQANEQINPIITLHGNNLPIKSSWNGDCVPLVNQGVFSGKVTQKRPGSRSTSNEYAARAQPATNNDDLVQQMQQQQMEEIINMLQEDGLTIKETTVRDSFTLYIDDPYYPPYNPTPVQPTQPTQPGMLPPQTGDMPLWYAIVHFLGLA